MKPIYQSIINPTNGDCMRAVIASLLEVDINSLPNYIELGKDWWNAMLQDVKEHGYKYDTMLHNKQYQELMRPILDCFKPVKWHRPSMITPKCLYKEEGIKGYFYAGVLSPKFFSWKDQNTHAVIIDRDFNIVHDPNPEYGSLIGYPLKNILKYNGVIDVTIFNPIN